jgi:transcriptional regulator with XRE-family HTH domain
MNNETTSEQASSPLIDSLREEIQEDKSDSAGDPTVPGEILGLLAHADVPGEVGLAIDDLLVEEDTISGVLHSRLVALVSEEMKIRSAAPRYLEEILLARREEIALTSSELAERLPITADRIEAVERARVGLGSLNERDIAAWIHELDLNIDEAVGALETSLLQPASAYRGDEPPRTRPAVAAFVSQVRLLLEEQRGLT